MDSLQIKFAVLGTEETCTGDPARRAGNDVLLQMQAMNNIQVLNGYGIKKIVTACPHCFNTLKNEYPELGGNYDVVHHSAFLQQLIDDGKLKFEGGAYKGKKITYHDSCSSLRELQVKRQPRELLAKIGGLSFKELPNGEPCCGFGGTFCVKFPDISNRMVEDKVANIEATGADVVLAADMGCLLNIAGKLKRAGSKVEARHVAEVLAGMADDAAIGEGQ